MNEKVFNVFDADISTKAQYKNFIIHMVENSSFFSVVYFKYQKHGKTSAIGKEFADALNPYKVRSYTTNMWPCNFTMDNRCQNKVVLYRCCPEVIETLLRLNSIWDWDHPAPMDLCFYKSEYCWFASIGHENISYLYCAEDEEKEFEQIGIDLTYERTISENSLFFLSYFRSGTVKKPYWN